MYLFPAVYVCQRRILYGSYSLGSRKERGQRNAGIVKRLLRDGQRDGPDNSRDPCQANPPTKMLSISIVAIIVVGCEFGEPYNDFHMSAFGGKADIVSIGDLCPLMTQNGHQVPSISAKKTA
jgi:hypothetical protein